VRRESPAEWHRQLSEILQAIGVRALGVGQEGARAAAALVRAAYFSIRSVT